MRVIVCGGRDYADPIRVWKVLDEVARTRGGISRIIEGASDDVTGPYIGADYWAHQYARARGLNVDRFHADWKRLGKAAGPIRNKKMLDDSLPDLVIAFPGGRGTRSMIELADKAGVEVMHVDGQSVKGDDK